MEDATGFEETPTGAGALLASVKKFGIGKLVLLLIVLGAALWFFVLAPKPTTLFMKFSELDSGDAIEGVQVDLTVGEKIRTEFSDENGKVSFKNVPAAILLDPQIIPPTGYKVSSGQEPDVTLKSDTPETKSIILARATKAKLELDQESLSLATECKITLNAKVTNEDKTALQVELVGDGALKNVIESEKKTIAPGATTNVSIQVNTPAKKSSVSGPIRIKYTDSATKLTLEATDGEQLKIGPTNFNERVDPNAAIKKQFTLENAAKTGEARDLKTEITGDFVQLDAKATFPDDLPLKPKERKILTLEMNAPSFDGKSVGVLIVSSACKRIQIPMELTVETRRR